MGLFPFASTVSSMSNSSAVPANAIAMRGSRDVRHSVRCWPPNGPHYSDRTARSSFSSISFNSISFIQSHISASCFGTVPRHAAPRPDCIRGAGGERGPP